MHVQGSNGSGKSTLIRIILGITKQTKGNILVNTNKEICYLGHKNALKNYLNLEDNIELMELNKQSDLKKYIEILGFKKLLDVNVANLSYGQQKKLALLRLFLNESDLIVLDEPLVGLDKETQEILNNFLVAALTLLSVACADKITAINNWKLVLYISSVTGFGVSFSKI